jgi:hypothetical protein
MTVGLLVTWPAAGGDNKAAAKSLVEEAQLLAGTGWTSDEDFSIVSSKEGDPRYKLTITFEPDKGKPLGKASLGLRFKLTGEKRSIDDPKLKLKGAVEVGVGGGVSFGPFSFELTGQPGKRVIKLVAPGATVDGKPVNNAPQLLDYSLHGDTLTVRPRLPSWPVHGATIHFRRDK